MRELWYGTTENIKGYFDLLDWDGIQSVLTVCSSGDHIFNLVNRGVKDIDVFDINPLTFPYFNLRMALVLTFSYEDYFKYFDKLTIASRNELEEYEIFSMIKHNFSSEYVSFWEKVFSENIINNPHDIMKPGLLAKMCSNYIAKHTNKIRNLYLSSEEEYERTRENLKNININFKNVDLFDIPNHFSKKYDKILLSNISDYLLLNSNYEFHDFLVNRLSQILEDNGELLCAYIYHYICFNEILGIHFKCSLNDNYDVFDTYDLLKIDHVTDEGNIEYGSKDAILVYHKVR